MNDTCQNSILDYIDITREIDNSKHMCIEHDVLTECRPLRELDNILNEARLNVISACKID